MVNIKPSEHQRVSTVLYNPIYFTNSVVFPQKHVYDPVFLYIGALGLVSSSEDSARCLVCLQLLFPPAET